MKVGLKFPDAERTTAPQSVKMFTQTARPQSSFDQHGRVPDQAALCASRLFRPGLSRVFALSQEGSLL